MEKESLKTIREKELENYLRKLNVLDAIRNGLAKCKFCSDVLETYEKHKINSHIEWKK